MTEGKALRRDGVKLMKGPLYERMIVMRRAPFRFSRDRHAHSNTNGGNSQTFGKAGSCEARSCGNVVGPRLAYLSTIYVSKYLESKQIIDKLICLPTSEFRVRKHSGKTPEEPIYSDGSCPTSPPTIMSSGLALGLTIISSDAFKMHLCFHFESIHPMASLERANIRSRLISPKETTCPISHQNPFQVVDHHPSFVSYPFGPKQCLEMNRFDD